MSIRPYLAPALILSAVACAYLAVQAIRLERFRKEAHPVFDSSGVVWRHGNPRGGYGELPVLESSGHRLALSCADLGIMSYPNCMGSGALVSGQAARVEWIRAPGSAWSRDLVRPTRIQQSGRSVYEQAIEDIQSDQTEELTNESIAAAILFSPFWIAAIHLLARKGKAPG